MPLYSEDVQDLMGKIPGRILNIGLTIIFCTTFMILIGSYFFEAPEIVTVPVRLTTLNPPQELHSKINGMIQHLAVQEQDTVYPGQVIAVISNTAIYEHVLRLEMLVHDDIAQEEWDSIIITRKLLPMLSLGEIQVNYMRWSKAWSNFRRYLQHNFLAQKMIIQQQQIITQRAEYEELCKQAYFKKMDINLTTKQFHRDSLFYSQHKDVVGLVNYEKQQQTFWQKKSTYMDFCAIVRRAKQEILKQENNLLDIKMQHEEELDKYRHDLDESYQLLKESYKQWQDKYLLSSNISGIVTLSDYWSSGQTIDIGKRIATIVPFEEQQIIAKSAISMNNIGKVENGQNVNIKLSGFLYMRFGVISGRIKNISLVADKESHYNAEIDLPEGMMSSYKEQLKFIHDIEGYADIITKDERLLFRLIKPFKTAIANR